MLVEDGLAGNNGGWASKGENVDGTKVRENNERAAWLGDTLHNGRFLGRGGGECGIGPAHLVQLALSCILTAHL